MEKGLDAVVANAINGINTMPAKGLCFDCTDDDLRAIVEYMIDSSNQKTKCFFKNELQAAHFFCLRFSKSLP